MTQKAASPVYSDRFQGIDFFFADKRGDRYNRERLKNREFGKEAAQIFVSGADGIAQEQDGTEDRKFALKPMQTKPILQSRSV